MIIKKFESFTSTYTGGGINQQQINSDLPRSPQISFSETAVEDNANIVKDIDVLSYPDIIVYKGSKYRVLDNNGFVIKVVSLSTNKNTVLNKAQISKFGVHLIDE